MADTCPAVRSFLCYYVGYMRQVRCPAACILICDREETETDVPHEEPIGLVRKAQKRGVTSSVTHDPRPSKEAGEASTGGQNKTDNGEMG